jgi:hypothetical protein
LKFTNITTVPKTTFNLWTYQAEKKINLRMVAALEREKKSWISALEKAIASKAAHLHEMFCKLSFETTKMDAPKQLILSIPPSLSTPLTLTHPLTYSLVTHYSINTHSLTTLLF